MIAPRPAEPRVQPAAAPLDYDAGGQIADLQAEIERRMRADSRLPAHDPAADRVERAIRRLSVVGGYVALGTGYAVAAALWMRFA